MVLNRAAALVSPSKLELSFKVDDPGRRGCLELDNLLRDKHRLTCRFKPTSRPGAPLSGRAVRTIRTYVFQRLASHQGALGDCEQAQLVEDGIYLWRLAGRPPGRGLHRFPAGRSERGGGDGLAEVLAGLCDHAAFLLGWLSLAAIL